MGSIDEMLLDEEMIGVCIENNDNALESLNHFVDQISAKVDKLERRLNEVDQFYSASNKKSQNSKASSKKHQAVSKKNATSPKKMQELMLQCGTVLRQTKRHKVEDIQTLLDIELSLEAAHAKNARDISNELYEVDLYLEELRERVVQKCRKISMEEKRKLGVALAEMSPEDLGKALDIVAQNNPSFQASAEEVDLDMDAQSESTLWRLMFFAKDAKVHEKCSVVTCGNTSNQASNVATATTTKIDNITTNSSKRKREICEAIFIIKNKKTKQLSGDVQ